MIIETSSTQNKVYFEQVVVGTSEVDLPLSTRVLARGVNIKAHTGNAGTVYVGGPGVTASNGYPLAAGDSLFLAVESPTQVKLIAGVADQDVSVIGL